MRYRRFARFLCAVLLVVPAPAAAQRPARMDGDRLSDHPQFYLAVNLLLAGTSSWVRAHFSGADPGRAFAKGMGAGAVTYVGQVMVGSGDRRLRFPGLQTVALGANLARNAGDGVPLLSDLTFPVYPLYVRVQSRDGRPPVSARLSVMSVLAMLKYSRQWPGELDRRETLASGAPVFRSPYQFVDCTAPSKHSCDRNRNGQAKGGVTIYAGAKTPEEAERIVHHEAGHVAQFTRDAVLHAVPMSDVALRYAARGTWVGGKMAGALSRYLVLDFFLPIAALKEMTEPLDHNYGSDNFYERETDAMMGLDLCERRRYTCRW
jgi:hypothetical protein